MASEVGIYFGEKKQSIFQYLEQMISFNSGQP